MLVLLLKKLLLLPLSDRDSGLDKKTLLKKKKKTQKLKLLVVPL